MQLPQEQNIEYLSGQIFDSLPQAAMVVQGDDIVLFNSAASTLFGWLQPPLTMLEILTAYQPSGKPSNDVWQFFSSSEDYQKQNDNFKARKYNGNIIDININAVKLKGTNMLILYINNITNDLRYQSKNDQIETKLSILFNKAPVYLKISNARNLFVDFNAKYTELIPNNNIELVNGGWIETILEEDRYRVLAKMDQAYKSGLLTRTLIELGKVTG